MRWPDICVRIGVLGANGQFDIMSNLNSTIALKGFLLEIQHGPDGAIIDRWTVPDTTQWRRR